MKKLLVSIICLLTIVSTYLFWISFVFNMQFIDITGVPLLIQDYHNANGHIYLIILLVLLLTVTALFVLYAYKDSKLVEIYDDQRTAIEFHEKANLFSFKRVLSFILLICAILTTVDSVYRVFNYASDVIYTDIFKRDLILASIDFIFIYFLILIASLIFELINESEKIYVSEKPDYLGIPR